MQILVVDDNSDRVALVRSVCAEFDTDYSVDQAFSVYEAMITLKRKRYDILLVDIQIPDRAGEATSQRGGINLIERIEIDSSLHKPQHVIGITVHEESYDHCRADFSDRGWALFLDGGEPGLIAKVLRSRLEYTRSPVESFDVAVMTALRHTEYEAVLGTGETWVPIRRDGDPSVYQATKLATTSGREISIVSGYCHHMGIASAASLATRMNKAFSPKLFLMVGIAAGVKGKADIGDVLIADPCWDWGSGKITMVDDKLTFLSSPFQVGLSPALRSKLLACAADGSFLDELYRSWPGHERPQRAPNAIVGPFATGSLVLESEEILNTIKKQNRGTVGLDMEAYGFMYALHYGSASPPHFAVIKAVCDFADPEKNDRWQKYAAYMSWGYAKRLLEEGVLT